MFVFIIQQIECDQAMKEEKNNFLLHIRWARIIFLGIIFLRHLRNRKIENLMLRTISGKEIEEHFMLSGKKPKEYLMLQWFLEKRKEYLMLSFIFMSMV